MDNRFREHTGNSNEQPSGLPLSEAGAAQAAGAVENLAAAIHGNVRLTMADMEDFANTLYGAVEVEIGGSKFSLERLKSHPELKRNAAIWQEVISRDYGRCEELTMLTPAVAAALAEFQGDGLYLNGLAALDPAAAAALAEFKGRGLDLNGLAALDPAAAAALAEFKGRGLYLDGLAALDADTAKALAQFRGDWLDLNGLTALDPEAAKALAQFTGTLFCQGDIRAQINRYKPQPLK